MASEQYLEERRLKLHKELVKILGSNNVYFQPPESIKMKYPAIVYERSNMFIPHASNVVYFTQCTYRVTVIESDPDGAIANKMSRFPTASFNRHYNMDNLSHDVFTINY